MPARATSRNTIKGYKYEMSTRLKKPNTRVVLNSKEISEMMIKVRMNMMVPLESMVFCYLYKILK